MCVKRKMQKINRILAGVLVFLCAFLSAFQTSNVWAKQEVPSEIQDKLMEMSIDDLPLNQVKLVKENTLPGIDLSLVAIEEAKAKEGTSYTEQFADSLSAEEKAEIDAQLMEICQEDVSGNSIDVQQIGFVTIEEGAEYLKQQLLQHKTVISLKLAKQGESTSEQLREMIYKAVEEDGVCPPKEGAYLYWGLDRFSWNPIVNNKEYVTYRISVKYKTTLSQEKYVDKRIAEISKELKLKDESISDYDKLWAINQFTMDAIEYDYEHFNRREEEGIDYLPMYTAYKGLHDGTAVCLSYALIVHRLCKEAGIPVLLLDSTTHAFNLVRLGDFYYYMDATWDDQYPEPIYFLTDENTFTANGTQQDHLKLDKYKTAEYEAKYPISPISYKKYFVKEIASKLPCANLNETLADEYGRAVSLGGDGRPKFILLLNPAHGGSKLQSVIFDSLATDLQYDADFICIDVTPDYSQLTYDQASILKILKETYIKSEKVVFCPTSDKVSQIYNSYKTLFQYPDDRNSILLYVDVTNSIPYAFYGNEIGIDTYNALATQKLQNLYAAPVAKQICHDEVSLSWDAIGNADKYYIFVVDVDGKEKCVGISDCLSYVTRVQSGKDYTYFVKAYKAGVYLGASEETSVHTRKMYLKKNSKYAVDGIRYMVTISSAKSKEVSVCGLQNKKRKRVIIPDVVKIHGLTYKVTSIEKNAFANNKNMKLVTIGKNIRTIGSKAFYGCKKLKTISVHTGKLEKIGKNAFGKIAPKANVFLSKDYVPTKLYKTYSKMIRSRGLPPKAKIKR